MGVAESRRGPQGKMLPLPKMDVDEIAARLRQVFQEQGVVLGYLFRERLRKLAEVLARLQEKSADDQPTR